jgi:hypothetical protein
MRSNRRNPVIPLNEVNPQAVQFVLGTIPPEQAQAYLDHFAECLTRTGQNPALYYTQAHVDANASVQAIQEAAPRAVTPAAPSGDWALLVHPKVLAQVVVDLAERTGLPVPDNVFVYEGDWRRLTEVQPSPRAQPVAPVAQQPAPIVAAPPAADPYPQPTPISTSQYETAAPIQLAPDDVIEDAQFTQQSTPSQTGSLQPPAQAQQPSNVVSLHQQPVAQPQPEVAQEQPVGTGAYGLPQPIMAASKGKSPFDKDPSGTAPKSAPARQVRDILEMLPHLFASPAGDVVGTGNGQAQRTRMYTAALLIADTLLASVPDPSCPVGYLRHHLAHLRYHASQTPAGPTMLAFEKWLFTPGDE